MWSRPPRTLRPLGFHLRTRGLCLGGTRRKKTTRNNWNSLSRPVSHKGTGKGLPCVTDDDTSTVEGKNIHNPFVRGPPSLRFSGPTLPKGTSETGTPTLVPETFVYVKYLGYLICVRPIITRQSTVPWYGTKEVTSSFVFISVSTQVTGWVPVVRLCPL